MSKYQLMLKILDGICEEAPKNHRMKKSQSENNIDMLSHARSRALIHLYLKVKFGILSFSERDKYITDGPNDCGIDAYYIDKEDKKVYVIQSKFRNSESNFENKFLELSELNKMMIDEVVRGAQNIEFNGKIKQFQKELSEREYPGQYTFTIIFIANIKSDLKDNIARLYDKDYYINIVNYDTIYSDLIFPVVAGTYFRAKKLNIKLSLSSVARGANRVNYTTKIDGDIPVDIMLIFSPVLEIGRIMNVYRNTLLEFNPRSYLGLSNNNVNKDIKKSIIDTTYNYFPLLNNGITIVTDQVSYSDQIGSHNSATIDLINPQIINGGQTAYTLCEIYQQYRSDDERNHVFSGKEVLLKIITIREVESRQGTSSIPVDIKTEIIQRISRATNNQSPVNEVDRRANENIQLALQRVFFEKYGLFYNRKEGEFHDGVQAKYIKKDDQVDREDLARVSLALQFKISDTRANIQKVFQEENFNKLFDLGRVEDYAYGYACYLELKNYTGRGRELAKYRIEEFGNALRYGKFAVISILLNTPKLRKLIPSESTNIVLGRWKFFEDSVSKYLHNHKYFSERSADWSGYYKGDTLNNDILAFSTNEIWSKN